MKQEMITIPRKEYDELKEKARVNEELAKDVARGIHDILSGKAKVIE